MNAVHKRAKEAAERRRTYLESEIRVSPLLVLADCQDIADGYLAEHDPTPLTVEVLVGMGWELVRETIRWNGFEILTPLPELTTWRWWCHGLRQYHPPRTVGELRQLLMRMGE